MPGITVLGSLNITSEQNRQRLLPSRSLLCGEEDVLTMSQFLSIILTNELVISLSIFYTVLPCPTPGWVAENFTFLL